MSGVGLFTEGEIGNSAAEAEGTDLIPSTTGEVLGAQLRQTFAENNLSRLFRLISRNLEPYPITLSPEEANAEYGIPGRLVFTERVSRTIARDLYDFHINSAIREDVIARRSGGIATGGVARFMAGLPAAMIDPFNIAAAFIPGIREARVATLLGGAAAGVGGRVLVRGVSGASSGFIGAAALEPLSYWLAQKDLDDYTMGDVLMNLAFGAVLGGVLHSGLGAFRDRRALPDWSPEMREAALRHSVASLAEGRPVEAAAALDLVAVREARAELSTLMSTVTSVAREAENALTMTDSPRAAVEAARARLASLREELEQLRAEASDARSRIPEADTTTAARLLEIDKELAETIPAARRASLERERTMLTEGRDFGEDALEAARAQAELTGLEQARVRKAREAGLAAAQLVNAERRLAKAEKILSTRLAALTSREALVQELAARTLRRLAGRLGVELPREEAFDMASRIMRSRPEETRGVMDEVLNTLATRKTSGEYVPNEAAVAPGADLIARLDERLAAREKAAETRLLDGLRGSADPRDVAADKNAAVLRETAPKVDGRVADEIAEAERVTKDIEEAIKRADKSFADAETAAGREAPPPDPELIEADELAKEGESLARAFIAAAECAIGGRR